MLQPIRVEIAPGQVKVCQMYEMEDLLSIAAERVTMMYHNNPVSCQQYLYRAAYRSCYTALVGVLCCKAHCGERLHHNMNGYA